MSISKNYLYKVFKIIGIILMFIINILYGLGVYIVLPLGSLIIAFIIAVVTLNIDIHDNLLNKLTVDQERWFKTIENTTIKIENKTCQTFKLNQNILDTNKPIVSYNKFSSSEYWVDENIIHNELSEFNGFISALDKIMETKNIDSLWIFMRGYADKSKMEDKKYYLDNKYFYQQVNYYPSFNDEYFIINGSVRKNLLMKNNQYMNKDLIYLRANFVKEVYFTRLLKQLEYKNYYLEILEGKSIDIHDENLRKVDVYISFCKQNENLSILDNFYIFLRELRMLFFAK